MFQTKTITNTILVSLIFFTGLAETGRAQTPQVNAYFGLGSATDSSNGQQINTFGTGTLYTTPRITGLFADIGAGLMLTPHYGFGGEYSWRTSEGPYAGLTYRPVLYDFNAIWDPAGSTRKLVPEFQAGLGGAAIRFYSSSTTCDQFVGCSTSNVALESADHFQLHFSGALRYYVTPHFFLRPAVDAHWVKNLTQFGSNWMPEYTLGAGFSFGGD